MRGNAEGAGAEGGKQEHPISWENQGLKTRGSILSEFLRCSSDHNGISLSFGDPQERGPQG